MIAFILIILFICSMIYFLIKSRMDIPLILSVIALIISFGLFINTALYVSNYQYKGGTDLVTGGSVWTTMMWLELPILFVLTVLLWARVRKRK